MESDGAPRLRRARSSSAAETRALAVPGFDLTATHSDAWQLSSVPPSLIVIGAGVTGVQVASIFNAFGTRVHLVEVAPRILMSEDREVSEAVRCRAGRGRRPGRRERRTIDRFERCATGVRLVRSADDGPRSLEPRWRWSRPDGPPPPPG